MTHEGQAECEETRRGRLSAMVFDFTQTVDHRHFQPGVFAAISGRPDDCADALLSQIDCFDRPGNGGGCPSGIRILWRVNIPTCCIGIDARQKAVSALACRPAFSFEVRCKLHGILTGTCGASDDPHALLLQQLEINGAALQVADQLQGRLADHCVRVSVALAPIPEETAQVEPFHDVAATVVAWYGHMAPDGNGDVAPRAMNFFGQLNACRRGANDQYLANRQQIGPAVLARCDLVNVLCQLAGHLQYEGSVAGAGCNDDGPGLPIAPIRLDQVFEPFFTTKDVGDGTGIGLAFCHRIILSHGGQIWLDPEHRHGSRFGIRLPVTAASESADQTIPAAARVAGHVAILVVDDEVEVGELASMILAKQGYQVDVVNSGLEALRLLEKNSYDVVLSDLNMPGVDGRGIYDSIRRDYPDLLEKLAFMTGDTMGSASQHLLKESKRPYLEKPVSPADLRQLVEGLLSRQQGEQ